MIQNFLSETFWSSWSILSKSSGFILLGFVAAGVIKAFIPENIVRKHLGQGMSGVFKASLKNKLPSNRSGQVYRMLFTSALHKK